MHLGIDKDSGWIYEGLSAPEIPMPPGVTVTQATLIEKEEDWDSLPPGLQQDPFRWVFREDGFDTVTRTRRGRLYQSASSGQPNLVPVASHGYRLGSESQFNDRRNLFTFTACTELLRKPRRGVGQTLVLGDAEVSSAWRILQVERRVDGCVMLLLKALSPFGVVPDIDLDKIPVEYRGDVVSAVDRVLDAAFRESPISVVDQCRNALTVIVSRWMAKKKSDTTLLREDLGPLAKLLLKPDTALYTVGWVCGLVARLHSRGKDIERIYNDYRIPEEGDAELAVDTVGFVLREFGWAKS